jgi:predicted nucleic-acid-binding protein
LLRALEVYELDRLDCAEAYLVARAETTGVNEIVSFDRTIDRVPSVARRGAVTHRRTSAAALVALLPVG